MNNMQNGGCCCFNKDSATSPNDMNGFDGLRPINISLNSKVEVEIIKE